MISLSMYLKLCLIVPIVFNPSVYGMKKVSSLTEQARLHATQHLNISKLKELNSGSLHPMHYAAQLKDTSLIKHFVEQIIQQHASLDITDACSYTPLHKAAACGNTDVVMFLLAEGANYKLTTKSNETALSLAQNNNAPQTAEAIKRFIASKSTR